MLLVAGDFRTVNGVSRTGFVALDPITGATSTALPEPNHDVHDIAVDGDDAYIVGKFWNVDGTQREKAARIDVATATLDAAWAPFSDDTNILSVAVDPILDRVYLGGFFSGIDGVADSARLVATSRADGAVIPAFDPEPEGEVYDILATPDTVYATAGGPGGRVEIYETFTGARRASWFGDGDLQTLALAGNHVYAGGHHETGLGDGGAPSPVAQIDRTTDQVDPNWAPDLTTAEGFGVWALLATDTDLWVGGAITDAAPVPAAGFARYPLDTADGPDTAPPTAATALANPATSDISVRLTWAAATDDSGSVAYIVERDGVPIGATTATTIVDETVSSEQTYDYVVTTVDRAGQLGPATPPLSVTTLGPLSPIQVIPMGTDWAYRDNGIEPAADWTTVAYDDTAWAVGPAQLGANDGDEVTVIVNQPASYFRRTFDVGVDQVVADATLTFLRDDGIAVYINGVEVIRDNLPAGPLDQSTGATTTIFGTLEDEILTASIDPSLFGPGQNVVAARVHNAPGSSDMSFDAGLELRVGSVGGDTSAPTAPTALAVTSVTEGSAGLTWGPATDNVAVTSYAILRDGVEVGTTNQLHFTDGGLAPETSYTYTVTASDIAGNIGPASNAVTATTTALPAGAVTLVPVGASWRYRDTGIAPPLDWATIAFDDGGWPSGAAELGAGDGDETTVITNQPVMYYRHAFAVGDPSEIGSLTVWVRADDGAVIYLNGFEVARDNVGPGPVGNTTPALTYRWTTADESALRPFVIPASQLQSGLNVLAISVHNGSGSGDTSFAAELIAQYQVGPDTEAPAAPTGLSAITVTDTTADLQWNPAVDNIGVVSYTIYRDGSEVGTATATTFVDAGLSPSTAYSYTVTATDAAGNVSPASAALTVNTDGATLTPLAMNATWRYLDTGAAPGTGWTLASFDDSAWPSGPAELGVLDGGEATVITNQPVTYYRANFDIADPAMLAQAELALLADDGAVVYINGTEVVRDNVAPGPVDNATPAIDYRWTTPDETIPNVFVIPLGSLVSGTNVIAVSVHNAPGSNDVSFAAELTVQESAAPDSEAPSTPTGLVATVVDADRVDLVWNAATDNVGVAQYRVDRSDGASFVAVATTFSDLTVTADTTYDYTVVAMDAAGNESPPSAAITVTTDPLPPQPVVVLDAGASWQYLDTGVDPGATWADPSFDDTSWLGGTGEFGVGDGGEVTLINNNIVTYFRTTFDITDPTAVQQLTLSLIADDGAVVYINGVEVTRHNVAAGPVDNTTNAVDYVWGAAETTPVLLTLDPATLVAGTNTIAVSLHNAPGSSDLSFLASLEALI